jgi:hypothetical protein
MLRFQEELALVQGLEDRAWCCRLVLALARESFAAAGLAPQRVKRWAMEKREWEAKIALLNQNRKTGRQEFQPQPNGPANNELLETIGSRHPRR